MPVVLSQRTWHDNAKYLDREGVIYHFRITTHNGVNAVPNERTWKEAVREIVQILPREFSLTNVLAHHDEPQRQFPSNRFVDAKIRQSLQVPRDQGLLEFLRPGIYRRPDVAPSFSPLIDFAIAARFVSAAQAARVTLETWASFNL